MPINVVNIITVVDYRSLLRYQNNREREVAHYTYGMFFLIKRQLKNSKYEVKCECDKCFMAFRDITFVII